MHVSLLQVTLGVQAFARSAIKPRQSNKERRARERGRTAMGQLALYVPLHGQRTDQGGAKGKRKRAREREEEGKLRFEVNWSLG